MNELWEKVKKLEGSTLFTLVRKKPFVIERVLDDRIEFRPLSGKGAIRWSWRKQIENLVKIYREEGELTPARVAEEYPDDFNSSYLATVVDEISN